MILGYIENRSLIFPTLINNLCVNCIQEILNHCFDDIERFMLRLQQTAEAQSVLNQRNKKRSRKSKTNEAQEGEMRFSTITHTHTYSVSECLCLVWLWTVVK